jgi:hypothetical protein
VQQALVHAGVALQSGIAVLDDVGDRVGLIGKQPARCVQGLLHTVRQLPRTPSHSLRPLLGTNGQRSLGENEVRVAHQLPGIADHAFLCVQALLGGFERIDGHAMLLSLQLAQHRCLLQCQRNLPGQLVGGDGVQHLVDSGARCLIAPERVVYVSFG